LVAAWVDVAGAAAFCSVEALCTTVCDWPEFDESPPSWTCVLDWLVLLSFVADDVAVLELVCSVPLSSARAAWTWTKQSPTMHSSKAKQHRRGFHMQPPSVIATERERPRVAGFPSPRPGGALYDLCMSARVLLVEPNRIVRSGLKAELSQNGDAVVAEATNGVEALAAAEAQRPDVVLLDLELPDRSGLELCEALSTQLPGIPIIILSDRAHEPDVTAALECGARAYIAKDTPDLDLAAVVDRVLAGQSVLDPRAAAALVDARRAEEEPRLSRQELKVLRLVAEGLTNPEIGRRLYLSRHTVKEYLSHAMRKLEVANRVEAVRKATELGLIEGGAHATGRESLAYNRVGEPARSSELKVTPLKLEQLRAIPKER
jgi:DNA-binding NarL/FixJ family response regulator